MQILSFLPYRSQCMLHQVIKAKDNVKPAWGAKVDYTGNVTARMALWWCNSY